MVDQREESNVGDEKVRASAPYLAFQTFINAIDILDGGLPDQIDRSIYATQSGGTQGLILNAFEFFGFIDESGYVQERLRSLVGERGDKRAELLLQFIEDSYASIFSIGLDRATPKQLIDTFSRAFPSLGGATQRKAITFFLKALEYCGFAVGPYLRKSSRRSANGRKRRVSGSVARRTERGQKSQAALPQTSPSMESCIQVDLKSGGSVKLGVSVDLFELEGDEREFVFGLIDQLKSYERQKGGDTS